jgi:hypothetical protein
MGSNDRRRKALTLAEASDLASKPRGPEGLWCPRSPPCDQLIGGLRHVVGDRRHWPDHLCIPTSKWMTERWARQLGGEPIPDWSRRWPLPLGRDALGLHVEADGREVWVEPSLLLPFFEDELAIMAERLVIGEDVLDVFGLAPMDQAAYSAEDMSPLAWTAGRFAYSLVGYTVPGDQALKQTLTGLRAARRWWQEMIEGKPLPSSPNAGRRRLEDDRDGAWHETVRLALLRKNQHPSLRWEHIAVYLGVADDAEDRTRTLRRWRRRHREMGCRCAD